MTKPTFTPVLFDVDGTIVASGELVMECFQLTMEKLGMPPLPAESLRKVVGPPLAVSMNLLAGVPEEGVEEAVAIYRSFYLPRFLETPVYGGIEQLLADLHAAGIPLATATTKLEKMAKEQLEHLGLAKYFTVIAGATPDPLCTKATVVADALERLRSVGVETVNPVLVGDRSFDVEGAEINGIKVIAAGWGYGVPEEFDSEVVVAVAPDVDAARKYLI